MKLKSIISNDLPFDVPEIELASKVLNIRKWDFDLLKNEFPDLSTFELLSLLMQNRNSESISVVSESIEELYGVIVNSFNIKNDEDFDKVESIDIENEYKSSINFNLVTQDIDRSRLNEKAIRIKAIIRLQGKTITISNVGKIILRTFKLIGGRSGKPFSDEWDFESSFPTNIKENKSLRNLLIDFKSGAKEIINKELRSQQGLLVESRIPFLKKQIEMIKTNKKSEVTP
ncbi:hypothetical protein [Sphingobacterium sp. UBA2074]|uniref:hypothetical protein n=1 Tax=Sphingobacterium sp. UBA2074 TaxID=1947487 RepID=UPI00257C3F10|nr:hypothetical protein [Sphingobacterium sp. UBA2074]